MQFFRNFDFDTPSFWIGVGSASLLWWLAGRLRPHLVELREKASASSQMVRKDFQGGTQGRLDKNMLRYAQRQHLAWPLFALEEVFIQPKLLAPPLAWGIEPPAYAEDITDHALPYLPDGAELAALYHAPTMTLAEALQGGPHIAVTGPAGCGKSVMLAHLAMQVIRREPEAGNLAGRTTLLIHAADLPLPPRHPEQPLEPLIDAVASHTSAITQARIPAFLKTIISGGHALILVDGLDELPPAQIDEVITYLESVLAINPANRLVLAGDSPSIPGLTRLNCVPLAVMPWSYEQRTAFVRQWGILWEKFVGGSEESEPERVLLDGWLVTDTTPHSPFELTLKVWGAYAGDSLGPGLRPLVEAYLRRMTPHGAKGRQALQRLALQSIVTMKPAIARRQAGKWVEEFEIPAGGTYTASEEAPAEAAPPSGDGRKAGSTAGNTVGAKAAGKEAARIPRVLSGLIDAGLLRSHPGGRLTISHPLLTGFLAAEGLTAPDCSPNNFNLLMEQADWGTRLLTLGFLSMSDPQPAWMEAMITEPSTDALLEKLFTAARWLPLAPESFPWRARLMRQLVSVFGKDNLATGLRAQAVLALANSRSAGIDVLLRQSLAAPDPSLRQVAALGCGYLGDPKAVGELAQLLADYQPGVREAALLALVAIGDEHALETVATALLQGDDELRRLAAEALANHPGEGHPTLQEASGVEDIAVRRAAIFGLGRIRQPWATELVEKLRTDPQWIIQNAAVQTFEGLQAANPRLPEPLPPLADAPWLIEYAGEHGMGVTPGQPAFDLLYQLLRDGKYEHRLQALSYICRNGNESAVLPVLQMLYNTEDDLREAVLVTLRTLSLAGFEIPAPVQHGFAGVK